jgi:hypothetical protein
MLVNGLYIVIKLLNVKGKIVPVAMNHVMQTCTGLEG